MSNFLENLKNAADNGEFNSEAAKKIKEISELADTKVNSIKTKEDFNKLKEKLDELSDNTAITEKEALELNSEYELKMAKFKEIDAVNAQIAILIEIEDMVKLSISDMFEFINNLNEKFKDKLDEANRKYSNEFASQNKHYIELAEKIKSIENKYSELIKN